MANLRVTGGMVINLLVNGESLNTTLNSTAPLYQTFKKGTTEFAPDWAAMPDADRPVIFPRIYAVKEGRVLTATDVSWKYNNVDMVFDSTTGVATAPDICAGKIKQIDHNGSKALKIIGNVASDTNNDSDTVSFTGRVKASGQELFVSSDITILVEESTGSLHRLFLVMADDVIDGDEESLLMVAKLYNSGIPVTTGMQYEFVDVMGNVLQAKGTSNTLVVTRDMIGGELLVICKAYQGDTMVANEQRQVWDSTDPIRLSWEYGGDVWQSELQDATYSCHAYNQRTGKIATNVDITVKMLNNADKTDISSQFSITGASVLVTGTQIGQYKALYAHAEGVIAQ